MHSSGKILTYSNVESNVDSDGPAHEISGGKRGAKTLICNWAKVQSCDILVKNLAKSWLCLKKMSEAKLKSNGLTLAQEVLKQLIESVDDY